MWNTKTKEALDDAERTTYAAGVSESLETVINEAGRRAGIHPHEGTATVLRDFRRWVETIRDSAIKDATPITVIMIQLIEALETESMAAAELRRFKKRIVDALAMPQLPPGGDFTSDQIVDAVERVVQMPTAATEAADEDSARAAISELYRELSPWMGTVMHVDGWEMKLGVMAQGLRRSFGRIHEQPSDEPAIGNLHPQELAATKANVWKDFAAAALASGLPIDGAVERADRMLEEWLRKFAPRERVSSKWPIVVDSDAPREEQEAADVVVNLFTRTIVKERVASGRNFRDSSNVTMREIERATAWKREREARQKVKVPT